MYAEMFPQRLKKAREDAGFTQYDIANELNISQSTYSKYEGGKREPDIEKLAKIAVFLNISTDWLMGIGRKNDTETHQQQMKELKERENILKKIEKEAKNAI